MISPSRDRDRNPGIGLLILIILQLIATTYRLYSYPAPWVDEGWIGEVAARISAGAPPGNPSHGTLYHFHDRLYWMPPLYFFLLGGWFSLFQVDLLSGRLLNGLVGILTVIILYSYGRRRIGAAGAFAAGLIAIFEPFAWKAHRTIRFEPLIALLGLGLIAAIDRALEEEAGGRRSIHWWILGGSAAGLLLSAHPNGALFCAGALVLVLARRGPVVLRQAGPWAALGMAFLLILPYGFYCLSDAGGSFANFKGQNSFHLDAGASKPPFLREWRRYADFFPWPWRAPAAAAMLAVLSASLTDLRREFTRTLLLPAAVYLTGLLVLPNKTLLYLVPLVPFLALLAGSWWSRSRSRVALTVVSALVAGGVVVDAGLLHRNRGYDTRRAYAALRAELRPDDRVAGTFVTWWAVQPREFREFGRGATLETIRNFDPTIVMLGDRQWRQEARGIYRALARDLEPDLAARWHLMATVRDSTLGDVAIWRFTE